MWEKKNKEEVDVRHGCITGKMGLGCKLRNGVLVARAAGAVGVAVGSSGSNLQYTHGKEYSFITLVGME